MGNLFGEKLELCISEKVENQGFDGMNTHELGEAVDMVKDSYEIEMLKSKKKYYDTIVQAMHDGDQGDNEYYYDDVMGYPRTRSGNRMGYRGQRRTSDGRYAYHDGRMPEWNESYPAQMTRYGNYGSRYGYSHDEYMESKKNATPEQRKELLDDYLDEMYEMAKEMVEDMTPEEKAMWKQKLTRVVNM